MSENWHSVKIGDCCDILDSLRVPLNAEERDDIKGNIPYYGANGRQGYIDKFIFDEPLILLAEDGGYFDEYESRPIAYRISGKSWVNNHAHILRVVVGGSISQDFIFYCLEHKNITPFIKGGTRAKLNQAELREILIPKPPELIQNRIAEILSTVDEAIEQTEALIAKYQQIKAGLMHDLFTRGVTPDGHLRPTYKQAPHLYKESPLGWIPKEWGCFTIGELFTRRVERGRPGLSIMSITMSGGLVERDSVDRRVESNLLPEDHLLVRRGDIAYNMMRMWQGVLGRAENDGLVSPAYIVMTPGPNIESVFAEYLLSTERAIAWFKRLSYGVVDDRLRLYFHDLVRIRLVIPRSLPEQRAISKRLQTLESSIQQTAIYLAKLRQQKLGLMQDLLTGRVRVKVADPVSR